MLRKWDKLFICSVFVLMSAKIVMADQDFKVTDIRMENHPPAAIINGQPVEKGDKVDGAEVEDISNDSVTLKYQGKVIVSQIDAQALKEQQIADKNEQQNADDSGQQAAENETPSPNNSVPVENVEGSCNIGGGACFLKKGYILAISKDVFDEAYKLIEDHDKEALEILFSTGQIENTNGQEVYVENVHPFGGTAEVRLKGHTETLWTNIEATQ